MTATAERWAAVTAMHTGTQLQWGPNAVDRYLLDPKRIGFLFARYKFAAKMLADCTSIIDVGCGDGMGTVTFLADTKAVDIHGIDQDTALIDHAQQQLLPALRSARPHDHDRLTFWYEDILERDVSRSFDGACCLDVIEHIEPSRAAEFVRSIRGNLGDNGIAVIGTPNEYAAQYGSPQSLAGHINNYTPTRLKRGLGKHFRNVFLFSMNDEVVHTGFDKLAHYLIALCVGPKR